jgi:CBS domain-containing protein
MNISSLTHRSVVACDRLDNLERVADLMWTRDIGCVPVVDETGKLVGMITDRDVAMAAFLQNAPLSRIVVGSVMAKELVTCTTDDPIQAVVERMSARQLRRVPVVDRGGKLVGIISLNDIAQAAAAGKLALADVALLVAAIGKPRPFASVA